MRALLVPVGAEWYALDLAGVREVVPAPALTALPQAPPAVLGVFNLRGDVVPALDTAVLLGLGPMAEPTHAVVVETDRGLAALGTSGSPRAGELGEAAGPASLAGTLGRYATRAGVATLVDVLALTAPERIGPPA